MLFRESATIYRWKLRKIMSLKERTLKLIKIPRRSGNFIVLFIGGIIVLTISVIIFQFFLKMSADEIINSWLKSEKVNIQQGNLLSAVSRSQNLLIGGGFAKGIRLSKNTDGSVIELITMGIEEENFINKPSQIGIIEWTHARFFKWNARYTFPNDPTLTISFLFYSSKWVTFFWSYIALILLLILFSGLLISQIEQKESLQRERILKSAIERLITDEEVPDLLRSKVPTLVTHWKTFKTLLSEHKEQEKKLAVAIAKQEIINQITHDIRSPLSALNLIMTKIEASGDYKLIMTESIKRINEITNGYLKNRRNIGHTDSSEIEPNVSAKDLKIKRQNLIPIIDQIIREKRVILTNDDVEIIEDIARGEEHFSSVDAVEFSRVLSNLISNSIESIESIGWVRVSMRSSNTSSVITIHDNGKGIPRDVINKIGVRGFSFDKKEGNGLGISHAKSTIQAFGGEFEIQSQLGSGTMVTLKLPS